jgi:hypothetical protein
LHPELFGAQPELANSYIKPASPTQVEGDRVVVASATTDGSVKVTGIPRKIGLKIEKIFVKQVHVGSLVLMVLRQRFEGAMKTRIAIAISAYPDELCLDLISKSSR